MTATNRRPNVVLIVADDLGWSDLGCYGSSFYETPHLDRLAAEGVRFTDAYAAAPVCSPTRASLLSGKYPARVGVTQHIGGHGVGRLADVPSMHCLPSNEFSLARAFRQHGYTTWHVGKWHLGRRGSWPDRHGFDINIGGCHWGQPVTYVSPYECPTLADGPDGEYLTDRLTDEAIALLDGAGDRPFFLNLWHYAVHTPIEAPAQLVAKYERKAAALGLDQREQIADGEPYPVWHKQHLRIRRRLVQADPAYAAMVENLDTNVGRLLDVIDARGLRDETVIVFTSDNGGLSSAAGSPTCNKPLAEGKGWLADGGLRVPLVARAPGRVVAGVTVAEPVTSPDLYPTLLAAAGLPLEPGQHIDGRDVSPLMRDEHFEGGPIFWHYPHYGNQGDTPAAAVRDGPWKLVYHFEDHAETLYNLDWDISEIDDRRSREPEQADRLAGLLHDWLRTVGALVPKPNLNQPFDD